ncbi:MAG: DNA polymerase I [Rhodobacterales bacterium]|nr:MAG: DNA polymerase I [Rhodobacterales bacterium]
MKGNFGKGCHLQLIDGSAFIFRAYHALPPLTRKSDGLPIGAVAGFCNMLFRQVESASAQDAPTHVVVVFDHSGKSFRNEIFEGYKAHRPPAPEDLVPQFPLTRDATRAFNIACIEKEGFEADDIIATLAREGREAGGRVTILTSDKDMMQLVGDGVEMLDPMKNKRIDREGVAEKFGVGPERVVDVQALAGDSVDNVPGAPGIGIKTAALLINEYGDLDTLLARAEEIKQPKRRQTLIEKADQIRMSRELVRLDERVDLGDLTLDAFELRDPEADTLLPFLAEMEFRTLSKRIADQMGVESPEIVVPEAAVASAPTMPPIDPEKYQRVRDAGELALWLQKVRDRGYVAIDTETTSLDEMQAELVGISLAVAPGEACYIPLGHKAGSEDLFGAAELAEGQMDMQLALTILRPVLADPSLLKIGQNIKYDAKILERYKAPLVSVDDTMLLSYALNAGLHGHGMDELSKRYLNHTPIPIKDLIGTGKSAITFDKVPVADAVKYAAEDADITLRLWMLLKPRLHAERVTRVYETLERPLISVLKRMEVQGIAVNRDVLSRMSNAFAQKMAGLEAELHEIAGHPFNVQSPAQVGEILFGEMALEGGKKTKTGAWSTPANVLEDLATEHEFAARVLDYRQLAKLKSTYTDALQTHINPETGRVHTSYLQTGAATGRLASSDPNLQNIPIRTEEGRRIREAFIAPPGKKLISLDYSQIELRILAHMAGIDAMKTAFREGQDIHAATASEMFGVPLDEMTSEVRRRAKAINFGVIYGISGFGLARNLRIPRAEAQAFIDRYFERYPGIRSYMDATIAFAKEHSFVETLFGRKIHTTEINARGPQAGFAKRAAINAPIQGTAADIIRRAMIRMPEAIADLPATMLLQVHDELIFEVAEEAVEDAIAAIRPVMEGAAEPLLRLDVPLVVDAGQGDNWAQAH